MFWRVFKIQYLHGKKNKIIITLYALETLSTIFESLNDKYIFWRLLDENTIFGDLAKNNIFGDS